MRAAPFDRAELTAINRVFGNRTCVAAPKALLGETLGAAGGMSVAAALACFVDGTPPRAVVRGEAPRAIRNVLVTTIGFYGNASAVVLRKPS